MAIHHQPSDGALPRGIPRYQWAGTCSVYPHMYPQQNHIYQRPMIKGTPASSSNDPGTSKDVHRRLFSCLKSSRTEALSPTQGKICFMRSNRCCIPLCILNIARLFFEMLFLRRNSYPCSAANKALNWETISADSPAASNTAQVKLTGAGPGAVMMRSLTTAPWLL